MALINPSMFLYGFQITSNNQYISFGTNSGETGVNARTATLPLGYYSLSSLCTQVATSLSAADPLHVYTVTASRVYSGGSVINKVTIATSGTYLSIYFGTGNISNPASLLGFASADLTGATSYTGGSSSGTAVVPTQLGYKYQAPSTMNKNFGKTNVSASGLKESIVFSLQQFWQVQFKYIPDASIASTWLPLVQWMIQQRPLEFTPDITEPNTFYQGTLDNPNSGLELDLTEMLPDFPFLYQTPVMKFRVVNTS